MFFFIAGIQPKTIKLDEHAMMCPICGLYQAHFNRVDQYLSVFFIPIFRVKKGPPFLYCEKCGGLPQQPNSKSFRPEQKVVHMCHHCGEPVEPQYLFCPFCGRSVR